MNESTEYSVILLKSIHHFHGVFFTAVTNAMCFRQRRVWFIYKSLVLVHFRKNMGFFLVIKVRFL